MLCLPGGKINPNRDGSNDDQAVPTQGEVSNVEDNRIERDSKHISWEPQDLNIFRSQMPRQITKIMISSAIAASKVMLNPNTGNNKSTSGSVHIQRPMASIISSKCVEDRLNMKCHSGSNFHHFMTPTQKHLSAVYRTSRWAFLLIKNQKNPLIRNTPRLCTENSDI